MHTEITTHLLNGILGNRIFVSIHIRYMQLFNSEHIPKIKENNNNRTPVEHTITQQRYHLFVERTYIFGLQFTQFLFVVFFVDNFKV